MHGGTSATSRGELQLAPRTLHTARRPTYTKRSLLNATETILTVQQVYIGFRA